MDPASLDRLHDIVLPASVAWWPPAPGWYLAFALLLTGMIWLCRLQWRRWRANAYRRAAIRALARCDTLAAVAELLRRTALAAWPREQIVPLSGAAWLDFLDRSAGTRDFATGPARVLAVVAYDSSIAPDAASEATIRDSARRCIQRRQAPGPGA